MNITIVGAGFLGVMTGFCLADLGHNVIFYDKDKEKGKAICSGKPTFFEPGLAELAAKGVKGKKVTCAPTLKDAIKDSEVVFVCVTARLKDDQGNLDYTQIDEVGEEIALAMETPKTIVLRSLLPPGSGHHLKGIILKNQKKKVEFSVVSNPGFLRVGQAIENFKNADRIIIGTDGTERAKAALSKIYQSLETPTRPIIWTDMVTAEIIENATNTMLALKVSYINQIAELCDKTGSDIKVVERGMGLDKRISMEYLHAGIGYGGFSFPKVVRSFSRTLKEKKCHTEIIDAIETVNQRQKKSVLPKIMRMLGVIAGKAITVLGLSFKPNSSNIKDSPPISLIHELQVMGAYVKVYDPEAMPHAKKVLKGVIFCDNAYQALENSDLMLVATEWDEFKSLDFVKIKGIMRKHNVIDGRNIYDPELIRSLGFTYYGIGR